jgi:hypothetical protein
MGADRDLYTQTVPETQERRATIWLDVAADKSRIAVEDNVVGKAVGLDGRRHRFNRCGHREIRRDLSIHC